MKTLYPFAVIAGICFGAYPLFLRQCKLPNNVGVTIFTLTVCLGVLPFGLAQLKEADFAASNVKMAVIAGFISSAGMLAFNTYLAKSSKFNVGYLILFMGLVQLGVNTAYQLYVNSTLPPLKVVGIIFAFIAAILLGI